MLLFANQEDPHGVRTKPLMGGASVASAQLRGGGNQAGSGSVKTANCIQPLQGRKQRLRRRERVAKRRVGGAGVDKEQTSSFSDPQLSGAPRWALPTGKQQVKQVGSAEALSRITAGCGGRGKLRQLWNSRHAAYLRFKTCQTIFSIY